VGLPILCEAIYKPMDNLRNSHALPKMLAHRLEQDNVSYSPKLVERLYEKWLSEGISLL